MRVAALYDIHGNLPALEAVLADVREAAVDRIVVGGDVFLGPMPTETLARLLDLDRVDFIRGNCDREVLSAARGTENTELPEQVRQAIRWTARQLRPDDVRVAATWPDTIELPIEGLGHVLFCHATPGNDTDIFTRLTADETVLRVFREVKAAVVVCGHTHMPFDRTVGTTRIVNAGSVGMPFGGPGADWLLLGPDVQLRHTPYDLQRAAERIRATLYPQAEDFAGRYVLQPPSEQEMLEAFGRVQIK